MITLTAPAPASEDALASDLLSALGAREDRSRGFGKVAGTVPGAIPLLGGAPSADALPLDAIHQAAASLTQSPRDLVAALQYSSTPGIAGLREWIASRAGVDVRRVLVTNGAFHGLSLVFDALLDRGDRIVVEDPTYPLIFRDLQHHEVEVLPLPLGPDGFDIGSLEARLEACARPKLLYTVPEFHNPTGAITPPAQRARLLELAERYGFVIVSDNAYAGLAFPGVEVPADYDLDSDLVVHVRTFAKILGPGLRLGYLVLPHWLVDPVTRLRANQDQHSSVLVQSVVERIVGAGGHVPLDGGLDGIADRARAAYAHRFDLVAKLLDEAVPGGVTVDHRTGGIFLWARVQDPSVDLAAAQQVARTRTGTDVVLGRFFFLDPAAGDHGRLRIGISHLDEADLRAGVERLAAALTSPEARR